MREYVDNVGIFMVPSTLFGSDALGGAVSMTKKVLDEVQNKWTGAKYALQYD
jgi:outer membrane receptor for ferrienterochelin and colicin